MVQRFPSVDPLAETTPSWNPYNYVQNTPINAIDPDGRACVGCPSSRSNEDYNKNGMHKTNTRFEDMFEGDGNRGGIPSPPVDLFDYHHIGNNGGGDPPIRQGDVIPGTGGLVASSSEVVVTAPRYTMKSDNTRVITNQYIPGYGQGRGGIEVLGMGTGVDFLDAPYGTASNIVDVTQMLFPAGGGASSTWGLPNWMNTMIGAGKGVGLTDYLYGTEWVPTKQSASNINTGSHRVFTNKTRDTLIFESTSKHSESFKRVVYRKRGILIPSKDSIQVID